MSHRNEYIVLAGSAVVLLVGLALILQPSGGTHDPGERMQGSTYYTSPLGWKAAYRVLSRVGVRVGRLERDLALLPSDARVLILAGLKEDPSAQDLARLETWVTDGGTLIWLPRRENQVPVGDATLARFGWRLETADASDPIPIVATLRPLGGGDATYRLEVRDSWRLVRQTPGIYGTFAGPSAMPNACVEPLGDGRFIAIADPTLFTNSRIECADHALFLAHLLSQAAGDGRAYFDELHHGFAGKSGFWSLLWESPARWALLQGAVLLLLLALVAGRRLGPPYPRLDPGRRRRPIEFIEAFASLCQRRGARRLALVYLYDRFARQARERIGELTPTALAAAARIDVVEAERILGYAGLSPSDARSLAAAVAEIERVRRRLRRSED